jgi:outer membrane protein assembly factor BamB
MRFCTWVLLACSATALQASDLIYIANQSDNSVKLYNGATGAFIDTIVAANSGDLNQANGIAIGSNGSIYVSGQGSNNIARFSSAGTFEGDFVAAGVGGLNSPQAIHFGPDGNLYAVSSANDQILRYSGTTGAFLGVFATLGTPVHDGPIDFAFSSNGQVWVTTFDSGRILRLDAVTGAVLGSLPLPASADPLAFVGATFGPNGSFYVSGLDTNTFAGSVYEYSASGSLLGTVIANGMDGLATPSDLLFDSTGALDVLDVGNPSVLQFDASGAFVKTLVPAGSGGLDSGFFFADVTTPEPATLGAIFFGFLVLCAAPMLRRVSIKRLSALILRGGFMKQLTCALALTALVTGAVWAKDDPFCSKWKLNKDKSKVTGEQLKIEDLGDNKLKFTHGDESDTITMDGNDQPIHYGRTMSLTKESPTSFKMVIKREGKVLSSMTHSLSDDGNTQTVNGTDYRPDGTTSDFEVVNKRVGSGSGWTGTWESTKVDFNSPDVWDIEPNGSNGLSFKDAAYKETWSLTFDGKDYPGSGPDVPAGATLSGKRIDAHHFEMTAKINGKVTDHSTFEVSPDGKTMTVTVHQTGQPNPQMYVYDKM